MDSNTTPATNPGRSTEMTKTWTNTVKRHRKWSEAKGEMIDRFWVYLPDGTLLKTKAGSVHSFGSREAAEAELAKHQDVDATEAPEVHVFEISGNGPAPFRFVTAWSMPSRALLEANPEAYNRALAERPEGSSCICDHCGMDIMNHYIIQAADGHRFCVGSECVMKTGSPGLVSEAEMAHKRLANANRRARKQEARYAEAELERTVNGGFTDAELVELEREAEAHAYRKQLKASKPELAAALADSMTWEPDESTYEGRREATFKMLVLDDRGFKVWGTIPEALFGCRTLDDLVNLRVTFTAKVEQSDRDEAFGFYSRPTKAEVIADLELPSAIVPHDAPGSVWRVLLVLAQESGTDPWLRDRSRR
jgi:hypothetical protein